MQEYHWQEAYEDCKSYYREYGNLDFSYSYRGKSKTALKKWLQNCQKEYQNGTLSPEHTDQLNKIHALENVPIFPKKEDSSENQIIETDTVLLYVKEFLQKYHHLCIPMNYVCENGYPLGKWATSVRSRYKSGKISQELFQKLDRMGMVWDNQSYYWQKVYEDCQAYYEQHGNLDIPADYQGTTGVLLFDWLQTQHQKYEQDKLSQEQIEKLNALYIQDTLEETAPKVTNFISEQTVSALKHAEQFQAEFQHLCIPSDYICADGYPLGKWARSTRNRYRNGELAKEIVEKLNLLGMVWDLLEYRWNEVFQDCKSYYKEHENLNIPVNFRGTSGVLLRSWLFTQRMKHKQNQLSQEQIDTLNSIHALEIQLKLPETQNAALLRSKYAMEQGIQHIRQFYEEHQHLCFLNDYVCEDGYALGKFARKVRTAHNQGKLSEEVTRKLQETGFLWNQHEQIWMCIYQDCKTYYETHGNLDIPSDMRSRCGYEMKAWLNSNCRAYYSGTLSEEKSRLLEQFIDAKAELSSQTYSEESLQIWKENCMKVKAFYEKYHHLTIPPTMKSKNGVSLKRWLVSQRSLLRTDKMPENKVKFLHENGLLQIFYPQYQINLALSKSQHDSLQQKALDAGYNNISEYLMSLIDETAE